MCTPLIELGKKLSIEPTQLESIIRNTVMPAKVPVSNEQFVTFLSVANEYNLNPLTKEIYAFPAQGGGIQPIVSIDGWLSIINNHPQFDGVEFEDSINEGKLLAVTCRIYRKDRARPTEITEYLSECKRESQPWKKWPSRMLRHKAMIQCARYAFSLSGIIDEDEAERFREVGVIQSENSQASRLADKLLEKPKEPEVQLDAILSQLQEANTLEELRNVGLEAKSLFLDEDKQTARDIYEIRKQELSGD